VSIRLKNKKSVELFNYYAGPLKQSLFLDDTTWLVFFYLYAEKFFSKMPTHSAYDICKSLNAIQKSDAPIYGPKHFTEKRVCEALTTLSMWGFVLEKEFHNKKKVKSSGRPPKHVYEIESMAKIIEKVKEHAQKKMQQAIDVFQPLQHVEEAAVNKNEEID
jgi:hypothetical protein